MLNFFLILYLSYSPFALTTDDFIYTRGKRELTKSIIDDENCLEVKTLCFNSNEKDDLSILECLLATNPERLKSINKQCQKTIREHKKLLLQDSNVKNYLNPVCENELKQLPCKVDSSDIYGHYLKCIISNINDIQNNDCYQALLHLENVAFRDDIFIEKFIEHCEDDIHNLGCRKGNSENNSPTTAMMCLQEKILLIKNWDCKKEVFRFSEVQSNNINMDAQLYIDCSNDVSRYCSNHSPGTGMVIPCLMQQFLLDRSKFDKKCAHHLMRRQKLIAADFSVSKGLLRSCREDIKKGACRKRQNSSDKTVRLAQILLCLENLMRNGTKIDTECSKEMVDHRRMLMDDYRLSPEIVNSCKNETQVYCQKYEFGGRTIHCLMNQALIDGNSVTPRLSNACLRALEDLVKKADVGENWSVDPVLHEACDPVVKVACKDVKSGNARVISCLMDTLRSDSMTEECENALTEIQYFVSRDFKLDPKLYKACQQDASENCHYFDPSESENGPSFSSQVLPCLYRLAYQPKDDRRISHSCMIEIQRVMRQRAISVDLEPEIEEVCVRDLGTFCKDKSKKGEEMQCLQDNMDDLDKECHEAVESFTEIEAQHVELNPFISKYCSKIIETLCKPETSEEDGGVMDCLIENKNNPLVKANPACRGSIEHFQIISLKDFRFTYKFKVACKPYAIRLCATRAGTKSEVVACLSEQILNATIQRMKSSISKDCRQQLKTQIFQQKEKISLDPILKKACASDIKKFCENIQVGNAQILECLQTQKDLSSSCAKEVFKIQKLEVYDNTLDFALQTLCAGAIDQFCPHHEKNTIFECLKLNKDEKGFNQNCREIVKHRLIEQNMNNFLNPALQKNCQIDITKFCKKDLLHMDEKNIGDSVIRCLKGPLKHAQLSASCEKEVLDILRDRALDVNLNLMIRLACKLELDTICKVESDESGKVEECLKVSYINKNIPTAECKQEVANMIEESKTDIQVDPILQRACAFDLLALCNKVEQGNGRHIKCLKSVMESRTQSLSPKCKTKLQERLVMYKHAAQDSVDDLTDLAQQVYSSPAKNYLVIMLFVMISGIFLIGVFCGRTFRRNYKVLKNK